MKIIQPRIADNKIDSLWYDGLIATYKGFQLIATGHITLRFEPNGSHYSDDQVREELEYRNYTDSDIYKLFDDNLISENNWFEVLYPNGDSDMGTVVNTYDDAIKLLKTYGDDDEAIQ